MNLREFSSSSLDGTQCHTFCSSDCFYVNSCGVGSSCTTSSNLFSHIDTKFAHST